MKKRTEKVKQQNGKKWQSVFAWQLEVVTAIFLLALIVFMARFIYKEEKNIHNNAQQEMLGIVSDYALEIDKILDNTLDLCRVGAGMISEGNTKPLDYMKAAYKLTNVSGVYLLDDTGKGYSHNGGSVDMSDVSGIFEVSQGLHGEIIRDTRPGVSDAVLCVSSVADPDGKIFYFVVSVQCDRITDIFNAKDYDGLTVFLLMDNEGDILVQSGGRSTLLNKDSLWDVVKTSDNEMTRFKSVIKKGGSGYVDWTYNNEKRRLFTTPVGTTNMRLVGAVNQTYIKYKLAKETSEVKVLKTYMIYSILSYVVIMVFLLVSYSMKYNKTKKNLEERADTDLLTGLNNKLATERKIKDYMEENPDSPCMVMIFDIDKFKKINDTKGHAFGDEVIRSVGQNITLQFRVTDIIGRIGGDEFMIFLKNIENEEIALKEAKKLMHFFKDFEVGGYVKYSPTASVGAAMYPADGKTFEELYKAADEALYRSKQNGRNQLNFYNANIETVR